jgi:hypothetical protein
VLQDRYVVDSEVELHEPLERRLRAAAAQEPARLVEQLAHRGNRPSLVEHETEEAREPGEELLGRRVGVEQDVA